MHSYCYVAILIIYIIIGSILAKSIEYSAFVKGPICKPSEPVRYPQNYNEVVAIVREGIRRNITVKAFGAKHSATDIICTDGIPIDMHGIRGMSLDVNNVVTVGAGTTVTHLTEFLMEHGRGLPVIPAFQNITVGGAIGTGAHGSSLRYPASLSDQAIEFLIIDGLGNVRQIRDEEDLKSFRIHLGLLGIILEVKFLTVPLFKLRAHNYVTNDDILLDSRAVQMASGMDQIIYYWFPSFHKVVIANLTHIEDVNVPGNAHTNALIPPTTESFAFIGKHSLEFAQKRNSHLLMSLFQLVSYAALLVTIPDVLPIYSENDIHVLNPAIGYYHRLSSVGCLEEGWIQCPWAHGPNGARALDNEVAIDVKDVPSFARRVKDILAKEPAYFPFEGILIRFARASTSHMSLSQGRHSCHIEFYPLERKRRYDDLTMGMSTYQTIMQSLIHEFSARSHWGKSGFHYHTEPLLHKKLDPQARIEFLKTMKIYDPNGLYLNKFGRRMLGLSQEMDSDPQVKHCALLDNCICSRDEDCGARGSGQICSRIRGYPNYPVCKRIRLFGKLSLPLLSKFSNKF